MAAHVHAALMAEYAKDAAESETPWENWEFCYTHSSRWETFYCHPSWTETCKYRRKPKTIRIGEIDVPEPMREAPKINTYYWLAMGGPIDFTTRFTYRNDAADKEYIKRGLCHATKEAAEAHTKALILISGGTF